MLRPAMAKAVIASTDLKKNQERAVLMVASGMTGVAIAAELDVTPETVSRWKQESAFQAEVNALLHETRAFVRRRMGVLASKAISIVESALDDAKLAPGDRLKAAFKVLDMYGAPALARERPGPTTEHAVKMQEMLRAPFD